MSADKSNVAFEVLGVDVSATRHVYGGINITDNTDMLVIQQNKKWWKVMKIRASKPILLIICLFFAALVGYM